MSVSKVNPECVIFDDKLKDTRRFRKNAVQYYKYEVLETSKPTHNASSLDFAPPCSWPINYRL